METIVKGLYFKKVLSSSVLILLTSASLPHLHEH